MQLHPRLASVAKAAGTLLLVLCSFTPQAQAQARETYPSKPVKMVVPFTAGGSIDALARLIGTQLATRLGQSFVIDNRAGAGGTVGADFVAKSAADGHTLLFTAQGPLVLNPFMMKRLPYNAETAFSTVTVVAEAPNVIVAGTQAPFRNLAELLALARAQPDQRAFASQGVGTTGHVTGELVSQQVGVNLVHVPYQGFPAMLTDVMAGRVGMMIADTINVVPRIRANQLKPIAIASAKRSSVLPEVPTFAELGYPEIVSGPWFSIVAPAGTSLEVRHKLAAEIKEILKTPEVQAKLRELGVESRGLSPEEFDTFLRAEYKRWGKVIRTANISLKD